MPTVRGKARTKAFMRKLPEQIANGMLRGAARAAIGVIEEEAAERVTSDTVREALKVTVRRREDKIFATLSVEPGWARSLGTWLEYGTIGHFISVDMTESGGRSARRVNELAKQGTIVIGGKPVGATVWHPGAEAHPFMRVSLDVKGDDARRAAQQFINTAAPRLGVAGGGSGE